MVDFKKLAAEFPREDIYWRRGGGNTNLAYLDARAVMDRLDDVVGPENWSDNYEETKSGRVICTIEIKVHQGDKNDRFGSWTAKSDGAGDTKVEGEKGAISDAFKRAAVKWGIGRYLYDFPVIKIQGSDKDPDYHMKCWEAYDAATCGALGFRTARERTACWNNAQARIGEAADIDELKAIWEIELQGDLKRLRISDAQLYDSLFELKERRKEALQA